MNGVKVIKGGTKKAGETPQAAPHSVLTPTVVHGPHGNPEMPSGASQVQKYFHSNTKRNCPSHRGDVCMAGREGTGGSGSCLSSAKPGCGYYTLCHRTPGCFNHVPVSFKKALSGGVKGTLGP